MKRFIPTLPALLLFCACTPLLYASDYVNHRLSIKLMPETGRIQVQDSITLPKNMPTSSGKIHLLLHSGLSPISATPGVKLQLAKEKSSPQDFFLAQETFPEAFDVPVDHYVITLPRNKKEFVITYRGSIIHPLDRTGTSYSGGVGGTPGLISAKGVFLASSSFWYPWFNRDLVTFSIEATLPGGWQVVSQGEKILDNQNAQGKKVHWKSSEPQDDIYLVGGPLTEYARPSGEIALYTYLRSPDPELAERYLSVTEKYITMYTQLIGPFPYKKFALVENFWETGYGMPSFTLLGPRVIRLPFILHSSYPHEILHNWWGNSVYIDSAKGNWSEGLTAYLADHLIKEQKGKGVEYRKSLLQKYTDFVTPENDFPLTEFRSRTSTLTQAVGYGKAAMVFHMLRTKLGDGLFIEFLQRLYYDNLFKRISFPEIRDLLVETEDSEAVDEFDQWITRPGAPSLAIDRITVEHDSGGYLLSGVLKQTQKGPGYVLRVPVAIYMKDQLFQTTIVMENKFKEFSVHLPAYPLRIDVDPEYDIFRRLDSAEISPSLSQAFGADKILILLPTRSRAGILNSFQEMAEKWSKSYPGKITIEKDSNIKEMPTDSAIWILGWDNIFITRIIGELQDYGIEVNKKNIKVKNYTLDRWDNSFVVATRNPLNKAMSLVWVATENTSAIAGLGRKLPHYSKYSYLGFTGNDPTNILKEQWEPKNSPMTVMIPPKFGITPGLNHTTLAPKSALIGYPDRP